MYRAIVRPSRPLFRKHPNIIQKHSFSTTPARQGWISTCADVFLALPNYPPFNILPASHAYTGVLIMSAIMLRSISSALRLYLRMKEARISYRLYHDGLSREQLQSIFKANRKMKEKKVFPELTEDKRVEAIADLVIQHEFEKLSKKYNYRPFRDVIMLLSVNVAIFYSAAMGIREGCERTVREASIVNDRQLAVPSSPSSETTNPSPDTSASTSSTSQYSEHTFLPDHLPNSEVDAFLASSKTVVNDFVGPSLANESFLWIPSLVTSDPYMIIPLAISVTYAISIGQNFGNPAKDAANHGEQADERYRRIQRRKDLLQIASIAYVVVICQTYGAVAIYMLSSALTSLLHNILEQRFFVAGSRVMGVLLDPSTVRRQLKDLVLAHLRIRKR